MALPTVLKVVLALVPSVVIATMHTTIMRASITAYSTAVGPSSAFTKSSTNCPNLRMCRALSVEWLSALDRRRSGGPVAFFAPASRQVGRFEDNLAHSLHGWATRGVSNTVNLPRKVVGSLDRERERVKNENHFYGPQFDAPANSISAHRAASAGWQPWSAIIIAGAWAVDYSEQTGTLVFPRNFAMRAVEIIGKKRDGGQLSPAEIEAFVTGATSHLWPDYQVSALLM